MRLVLLLLPLALAAGACSTTQPAASDTTRSHGSTAELEAVPDTFSLDTPFRLGYGDAARFPTDDVTVRFEGVLEDSRCPVGVDCVRAGEARARFTLVDAEGTEHAFTLTLPGGVMDVSDDPDVSPLVQASAYSLQLLRLQPYPGLDAEAEMPPTATLRMQRLTR